MKDKEDGMMKNDDSDAIMWQIVQKIDNQNRF